MGGGSQSSGSSTTTTSGSIPPWARPAYQGSTAQEIAAQSALPSISQIYSGVPTLGVPQLNSGQTTAISGLENQQQGPNAQEQAALSSLSGFTPGANGISPLTAATEAQFNQATLPTIENTAANMGQGNSGALLEAVQNGQVNALVPELTAQNSNQLQAATQTGNIGSTVYNQDVTNLTNALQAAGVPYAQAQQQAQAQYNQQEQQSQLGQEVQLGPFSSIPQIVGSGTSITTGTTGGGGSKF